MANFVSASVIPFFASCCLAYTLAAGTPPYGEDDYSSLQLFVNNVLIVKCSYAYDWPHAPAGQRRLYVNPNLTDWSYGSIPVKPNCEVFPSYDFYTTKLTISGLCDNSATYTVAYGGVSDSYSRSSTDSLWLGVYYDDWDVFNTYFDVTLNRSPLTYDKVCPTCNPAYTPFSQRCAPRRQ